MKKLVRSVALVLVLVLVLGLVPMAFAEELTQVTTEVTGIQKYGNLELKIKGSELQELGFEYGDIVTVGINGKNLEMPVVSNYSDVDQGSMLCRLVNDDDSKDYVVLAINMGNLAETAEIADKVKISEDPGFEWHYRDGVEVPVAVTITLTTPGGYYDQWLMHQLTRTNERSDYPDLNDSEFANFRQVSTTGMAPGVLYRSSSPVNPELNRNGYADAAMRGAGVKAVMNLADGKEEMEAYEGFADTYYSQQKIVPLNLGVDFASAEFKQGLADGFTFFANEEGPYLVHCTEGKDRAGFTSAVLEALMGASAEEIVADYMTTYFNYYGVEEGEQYDVIANSNIKKSLAAAFGIPDITAEGVDLAAEAHAYLTEDLGMDEETVALLKQKLSTPHVPGITALEKYGHADVAVPADEFLEHFDYGDVLTVTVNGCSMDMPVCSDYTDVPIKEPLIRVKPGKDHIGLAINYGKYCEEVGIGHKDDGTYVFNEDVTVPVPVDFVLAGKGAYRDAWESHHLERTDNREDYPGLTDEEFANFRNVATSGMGQNALYRSSSPINPEINRNTYADAAMEAAGIRVAMDLADDVETASSYEGFDNTYYSRQDNIYLNLDADFSSDGFKAGLKSGLEHMIAFKGPYLVHCNEGKDRAGFVSAVLEALMGASSDEVIADYMVSFYNYYGVTPGDAKYDIIARDNIVANLNLAFGVDILDPETDLQAAAITYLNEEIGLESKQILSLQKNLSRNYFSDSKFEDIQQNDWFYFYVTDLEHKNLMQGTTDTTFSPYANMNRAQMAAVLYRMAGEPEVAEPSTFTDVAPDTYYADAVAWAQDEGYLSGIGNGEFAPSHLASRQEFVTALYRFWNWTGPADVLSGFEDADQISDFAVPAMNWAVDCGIISGSAYADTAGLWLNPQEPVTRAQAAKICSVFMDLPVG